MNYSHQIAGLRALVHQLAAGADASADKAALVQEIDARLTSLEVQTLGVLHLATGAPDSGDDGSLAALRSQWSGAYDCFLNNFDTAYARRVMGGLCSNEARSGLAQFNEAMLAGAGSYSLGALAAQLTPGLQAVPLNNQSPAQLPFAPEAAAAAA